MSEVERGVSVAERYRSLDTKVKSNPLSLEEVRALTD